MKQLDEKDMRAREEQIPELAEIALKQAYHNSLASGRRVFEAINGQLIETHPDGTFRVLKSLPFPMSVTPGQRLIRL